MEVVNGGNGEEEVVPRWYEPGGRLNIPLSLLQKINESRADYNNPAYWKGVRQRQREAARTENAEKEAAAVAGNEIDDEGGHEEEEDLIDPEEGDDEYQGNDGGEGIGAENALESEETLKTVELTEDVKGRDAEGKEQAGTGEVPVGAVIFGQEEVNGLIEVEEDEAEAGQGKEVNIRTTGEDDERTQKAVGGDKMEGYVGGGSLLSEDSEKEDDDTGGDLMGVDEGSRNEKVDVVGDGDQSANGKDSGTKAPSEEDPIKDGVMGDPSVELPPPSSKACFNLKKVKTTSSNSKNDESPFTCPVCHRILYSKDTLRKHSFVHSGVKPFACGVCDKRFVDRAKLNVHAAVHASERNFICKICGKGFAHQYHLKGHLKVHSDQRQRPYECLQCSKRFLQKGNLDQHLLIHTGEFPFKCDLCQKAFRQKGNLNIHRKNCENRSKKAAKKMANDSEQGNSSEVTHVSNNMADLPRAAADGGRVTDGDTNGNVP